MKKAAVRLLFSLYHGLIVLAVLYAVGREKLLDREADAPEHGAGVILGGAYALLFGQAVIIGGDEKLCAALETNDRKLSQRHIDLTAAAVDDQILTKGVDDLLGNIPLLDAGLGQGSVGKGHVQSDGVNGVYLGKGHIVCTAQNAAVVGGEGLHSALGAEEHDSLVKYRKTCKHLICREGLAGYLVEIGDVNGVIAAVEADLLYRHLTVKQLRRAWTHAESALYVGLRAYGGVNP